MDIIASKIINVIGNLIIAELNNNDIVTFEKPFYSLTFDTNTGFIIDEELKRYFCDSECGYYQAIAIYKESTFTGFEQIEITNL